MFAKKLTKPPKAPGTDIFKKLKKGNKLSFKGKGGKISFRNFAKNVGVSALSAKISAQKKKFKVKRMAEK